MDSTEFSEGQYITPALVNDSPSKVGLILSEAKPEDTKYGKQLTCTVSLDKKVKIWRLNKDSVRNMQEISKNTELWITKKVLFTVVTVTGKERVIGKPIID